jgi:hypothetical protein
MDGSHPEEEDAMTNSGFLAAGSDVQPVDEPKADKSLEAPVAPEWRTDSGGSDPGVDDNSKSESKNIEMFEETETESGSDPGTSDTNKVDKGL